jgi:hypothetical protein
VGESISGSSSSHMPNLCKEHDTTKVDKQFVRLFILNRFFFFFDAIQSLIFKVVNGAAEHGTGYKLPSSFTLK